MTTRSSAALVLALGIAAVVVAVGSGTAPSFVAAIASPPAVVRAALVGAAAVLGAYLVVLALRRIEETRAGGPQAGAAGPEAGAAEPQEAGARMSTAQLGAMVRGIRFVFLAAAAFAAAIGWLVGDPLPIVIGLVIAGVDLAETSFLLLVATARG